MDCLMIFNHLNDLMFTKYNEYFEKHIRSLAVNQGLLAKGQLGRSLDYNIFIQIFSPIVSSHRIMHFQFGNSYTSIQFHKDVKVYFYEYMGYLFMAITDGLIKNLIDIYVTFAKYICGPDIHQLRVNASKSALFGRLIDEWLLLRNKDQAIFVEAVEQLVINNDISSTCLHALKDSMSRLSADAGCSKVHALLFVENKFLSLYSSSSAKQLSPADILFIIILTHCMSEEPGKVQSFQVLLSGTGQDSRCLPHVVHIVELFEHIFLVYLIEIGDALVSAALYEAFYHLHRLRFIQVQREKGSIQLGYENLGLAIRKLNDGLKKCKIKNVDTLHKQLMKNWANLKEKYKEYLRSNSDAAILRAETLAVNFLDDLIQFYKLTSIDESVMSCSLTDVASGIPKIITDLEDFNEFFKVKGIKNFSLGSSDSLTIYKYLEEFPGLVHFLYIDRNAHRLTTPSLDMQADKAEFIQQRIWSMVLFAHSHLQEGHTTIIWKDNIFTYGYFLWFEGNGGEPLKLTNVGSIGDKNPGLLAEDYYMKLKMSCFPKMSPVKVQAYELFVMHLGLMTASCVLEQTRKLAGTIWELKSFPTHAIDLL